MNKFTDKQKKRSQHKPVTTYRTIKTIILTSHSKYSKLLPSNPKIGMNRLNKNIIHLHRLQINSTKNQFNLFSLFLKCLCQLQLNCCGFENSISIKKGEEWGNGKIFSAQNTCGCCEMCAKCLKKLMKNISFH